MVPHMLSWHPLSTDASLILLAPKIRSSRWWTSQGTLWVEMDPRQIGQDIVTHCFLPPSLTAWDCHPGWDDQEATVSRDRPGFTAEPHHQISCPCLGLLKQSTVYLGTWVSAPTITKQLSGCPATCKPSNDGWSSFHKRVCISVIRQQKDPGLPTSQVSMTQLHGTQLNVLPLWTRLSSTEAVLDEASIKGHISPEDGWNWVQAGCQVELWMRWGKVLLHLPSGSQVPEPSLILKNVPASLRKNCDENEIRIPCNFLGGFAIWISYANA